MSTQIHLINGPNLNLLGTREPEIYGTKTLDQITTELKDYAQALGLDLLCFQSNAEGAIIDELQRIRTLTKGIIINPAAYSHTSIAIRDALSAIAGVPKVEVHLSNIYARESFRHHSHVSAIVDAVVCGMGSQGYFFAVDFLAKKI